MGGDAVAYNVSDALAECHHTRNAREGEGMVVAVAVAVACQFKVQEHEELLMPGKRR